MQGTVQLGAGYQAGVLLGRQCSEHGTCRQTASAVALLSPVTTMTRMPAPRQVASAAATSGRGGSCMPTRPANVSSLSSLSSTCGALQSCY